MEKISQNKILAIVIAAVVLVLILAECQAESALRDKETAESGEISETVEAADQTGDEDETTDAADSDEPDESESESVSDEATDEPEEPTESE